MHTRQLDAVFYAIRVAKHGEYTIKSEQVPKSSQNSVSELHDSQFRESVTGGNQYSGNQNEECLCWRRQQKFIQPDMEV
jgi:uncharacterized protein YifE (UPF0438 family)